MNKLKWKFQQFMIGRNGQDDLGQVTLIASLVIYVIALFTGNEVLSLLSWLGLVYTVFRCLSKSLGERRAENEKFLNEKKYWKMKVEQRKEYKIFKCKSCGRIVRVPKGKGKIEVTCPICGNKTIHKP